MLEQVLDAVLQRGGRGRAARAGALHGQEHDAFLVALEGDVAAVAGDRRAHASLDQILDGGDRIGVLGVVEFIRIGRLRRAPVCQQRRAADEVLHDGAEDRRLDLLPVAVALGDGDEVGAEEDASDIRNFEQCRGQRRLRGGGLVGHVEGAGFEHRPPGQELQRRRIGRGFGLNEHYQLLAGSRPVV